MAETAQRSRGAAEIFLNYEQKIPYYFGIASLCTMSTNNVEELLALASALYEGMKANQVLKRPNPARSCRRHVQEKKITGRCNSGREISSREIKKTGVFPGAS